ncbi:MAG: sulfatase-like hydrolase/transferase [Candidatus Eisenbacteria bacterium]|nr:sulfatase-like hydrolase/transferase [Candidatus Eisenbacteria bacterium]
MIWRSLKLAVLASLVALTGASCGPRKPARQPNVVLIVIDSLRADHLAYYGYDVDTTPFLSTVIPRGVAFRRVHSTSSWAAPAAASLVTSLYPAQHGVHSGVLATRTLQDIDPRVTLNRLPAGVGTMAEALRGAGYSTWGVSDDVDVSPDLGFDRGFDRFEHRTEIGASVVNAIVRGWAGEIRGAAPYFLYIHYSDPRRPYVTRAPWYTPRRREREDAMAAYDSEISYVDDHVRALYELLGWDRDTWLIVMSVHGEEFRDHGDWYHGRTLHGEVLSVPLIFASAAGDLKPRRVEEPISIVDVLPTVREIAGLAPDPADMGLSLMPVIRGDASPSLDRVVFAELRSPPWYGGREIKAAMRGHLKYVLTLPDREELFNIAADPGESRDLAWNRPDLRAELRGEIERLEAEAPRYADEPLRVVIDPRTVERLRSAVYAN